MHYLTISFTHKNTDIAIREKLAFNSDEKLNKFYSDVLSSEAINEMIILSTCNRVELITSVNDLKKSIDTIFTKLSDLTSVLIDRLKELGDIYEDEGAVHHLFAVASSLDSLVIGETQIMGQLKDAFRFSFESGYSGQKLARLMHHSFKCAATVRNSTEISKNAVSISSVAVTKAKEVLGNNLAGYTALIVGAGEMSELAAKHLVNAGVNLIIFNRSIDKAKDLAKNLESNVTIKVEPFSELKTHINNYRLLFSATGAPHTIITKDMVEEVDFDRYWFDIAVPRDIEDCNCDRVNIYAVDDLKSIVNTNMALREENAAKAYAIIGKFTIDFYKWLQSLAIDPIIKEIREKAKQASMNEVSRSIKKGYIPAKYEKQLSKTLHQAFNTFLHEPTLRLKTVAEQPQADTIVQSMQYVFNLNCDVEKKLNLYRCEYQIEKDISITDEQRGEKN